MHTYEHTIYRTKRHMHRVISHWQCFEAALGGDANWDSQVHVPRFPTMLPCAHYIKEGAPSGVVRVGTHEREPLSIECLSLKFK